MPGALPGARQPSRGLRLWALLCGSLVLSACQWTMERPSLPAPPLQQQSAVVAQDGDAPTGSPSLDADIDDGSPLRAAVKKQPKLNELGPEVTITDLVGTNMGAAGAMLAPSISEVERCAAPEGTVLKVRLFASRKRKTVQIDRSSTVSGDVGRCVIEALSRMSLDRTLQLSGSPSERGPIIEGLLIFNW